MALVKCSLFVKHQHSHFPSNIRNGDGPSFLYLGFLAATKQFPCLLCASCQWQTKRVCEFRMRYFQEQPFLAHESINQSRMMAVVNVNVKQWIVLMHFFPRHFANPCNVVLPDTQTQRRDVLSFFVIGRPFLVQNPQLWVWQEHISVRQKRALSRAWPKGKLAR